MPDEVTAQDSGQNFKSHDEGQFAAVCADVIDLGERVEQFENKPAKLTHKAALVFLTNTTGDTKDVSAEMTVSMNERATLRQFLERWRGKSYSPEQAQAGVPLNKLVGQAALISVEHKRSTKGRTYAKIQSIAPLPAGLAAPGLNGYTRAEFWKGRKEAYAKDAERFKQTIAKSDEPPPPDGDDLDDDLPF